MDNTCLQRILANLDCSEISAIDLKRAERRLRRFFQKVALPYLSHPSSPKAKRIRIKELADMAMHYFFERGEAQILKELSLPVQPEVQPEYNRLREFD